MLDLPLDEKAKNNNSKRDTEYIKPGLGTTNNGVQY